MIGQEGYAGLKSGQLFLVFLLVLLYFAKSLVLRDLRDPICAKKELESFLPEQTE